VKCSAERAAHALLNAGATDATRHGVGEEQAMRYAFLAALGVVLVGCSSSPLPVQSGEICFRCKRVITDAKLGVQMVNTSGQTSTFRTPGCLARYLKDHGNEARDVFVTDYASGKMIPVSRALFVRAKIDEATGERDYYAYASVNDAVERAKNVTGRVVDWAAVRSAIDSERFAKKGD
jgi:hypothetical protein